MARSPSVCGVLLTEAAADLAAQQNYLRQAIELLRGRTEMVLVVAGANFAAVAPTVYALGASLIENSAPGSGPFGALKIGLQEILNHGRDAALVTVADGPSVPSWVIERLEAEFLDALESGQWAVFPEFGSGSGYPFYVGREMMEAYLRAPLNAAAHDVEIASASRIRYVSFGDPESLASSKKPAAVS